MFMPYQACYEDFSCFPPSHLGAGQSVVSSDATCCPVRTEVIPLARSCLMTVRLTSEISCQSLNSCGHRRTMSRGWRPQQKSKCAARCSRSVGSISRMRSHHARLSSRCSSTAFPALVDPDEGLVVVCAYVRSVSSITLLRQARPYGRTAASRLL